MANVVIMPRQGQSVEACIITSWQKKKGEQVALGDVLFSYETDKSSFDEVSQFSGVVLGIFANEGDVVPCLEPVCVIGEEGEDVSSLFTGSTTDESLSKLEKNPTAAVEPEQDCASEKPPVAPLAVRADGRVFISPRAKNLALESGVDMTKVVPTGPHGRIIERDINAALDNGFVATTADVENYLAGIMPYEAEEEPVSPVPDEAASVEDVEKVEETMSAVQSAETASFAAEPPKYVDEPLSGVRRVIARTMHSSLSEMAQLTLNSSFNAASILALRAKLKEKGGDLGLGRVTITDMILYAVSRVLPKYPEINANLLDGVMRKYKNANVALAVDTERGLLVPVIFSAEKLSLGEISAKSKVLAEKARDGKCLPDEMNGGSFTVSNLGSLGVESFTPVINPPQTAILGVCCVTNRLDNEGKVYPAMGLSLTFDHRAVDGAPAARFLKELCLSLENFDLLLCK